MRLTITAVIQSCISGFSQLMASQNWQMAGTAGGRQQLAAHPAHFLLACSILPQLEEKLAPGLHTAHFEALHIHPLFFWPHLLLRAEQYQCLAPKGQGKSEQFGVAQVPQVLICVERWWVSACELPGVAAEEAVVPSEAHQSQGRNRCCWWVIASLKWRLEERLSLRAARPFRESSLPRCTISRHFNLSPGLKVLADTFLRQRPSQGSLGYKQSLWKVWHGLDLSLAAWGAGARLSFILQKFTSSSLHKKEH